MKTRVHWSPYQQLLIARRCLEVVCKNSGVTPALFMKSDVINDRNFLSQILRPAQEHVFSKTPEYIRELKAMSQVPWLADLMFQEAQIWKEHHLAELAAKNTPQAKAAEQSSAESGVSLHMDPASIAKFADVLAPLVAKLVVQQLVAEYDLHPKVLHEKARPFQPETVVKPKQVSVLVGGLLANQQHEVEAAWGKKFKLRFLDQDKRMRNIDGYDYAIALVTKFSHSKDERLSFQYGDRYIRVNGGVSAVKKGLNDLSSKLGY